MINLISLFKVTNASMFLSPLPYPSLSFYSNFIMCNPVKQIFTIALKNL